MYERGSGVTLSCGTGAVASAVAAAVAAGEWPPGADDPAEAGRRAAAGRPAAERAAGRAAAERPWTVDVPGGRLAVTASATASLLSGPAVIVAAGELDDAWLGEAAGRPVTISAIG